MWVAKDPKRLQADIVDFDQPAEFVRSISSTLVNVELQSAVCKNYVRRSENIQTFPAPVFPTATTHTY